MAFLGVIVVVLSAGLGAALATGPAGDGGSGTGPLFPDWTMASSSTWSYDGENTEVLEVPITEHNLTRLMVTLTWTDDERVGPLGYRADDLTLLVEGPPALGADTQTQGSNQGTITIQFDLARLPDDDDPSNFEAYDYTNATGEWSITVTVEANGLRDNGNAWTLTLNYYYYVGRLLEEAPGEG